MTRMDAVFKAYDIRGTVPDQLDGDMCRAIGRAMARFAGAPELLICRDMRQSGIELAAAFSAWPRPISCTSPPAIWTRRA